MFQRIDFTQLGGFPLTQNSMNFIQESYNNVLAALSRAVGDYVIISGVSETSPNNYSDGWVTYNGEIIPFSGGPEQSNVIIEEITADKTYNDGNVFTVQYTRKARFNSTGIPFTTFKQLSLDQLNTDLLAVENVANDALTIANNAASGGIPPGVIVMWSGAIANIPIGWALCDGADGRPDLTGRFIVGYKASDGDYDTIGKNGGSKTHTLTVAEMPTHNHAMLDAGAHTHSVLGQTGGDDNNNNNTQRFAGGDKGPAESGFFFTNTTAVQSAGSHSHTISNNGSSQPHENRPPYYTLAYIIKQ